MPVHTEKGRHNTEKSGYISMPRAGFEPTIPVFELSKTIRALDSAHPLGPILIQTAEAVSLNSSLFNILHPSVTSSALDPNILLGTLFLNTLNSYSHTVSGQLSNPYKIPF
jgi:hypothetical protein